LSSRQSHDAGADQRGQSRNQQKHGKAGDADPCARGGQEFDIAQPQPLDFSPGEIEPSQEQEYKANRRALAGGIQANPWATDEPGPRQSQTRNRQIQPVRNDSVANVDPGKDKAKALAAKGAEVVKADLDDVESLKKAFAGASTCRCSSFGGLAESTYL